MKVLGLGFVAASPCWYRGAASRKAWQRVRDLEPWDRLLGPHVIIDAYSFWFIKAPYSDLNAICKHFLVHGQRASAVRTKAALRKLGGAEARGLASNPSELLSGEVYERQRRSSRVLATHEAMTDDATNGR